MSTSFFPSSTTSPVATHHRTASYSDLDRFRDPDISVSGRRLFKPRETYEPKDLNDKNVVKHIQALERAPKIDILSELRIDPLKEYKNVAMLSHFVTEMGLIKPRTSTGLSLRNQGRMSKAIRRARAMGLMPYTYRLSIEEKDRNKYLNF